MAEGLAWGAARRTVAAGLPAVAGVAMAALLFRPPNLGWILLATFAWAPVAYAVVAGGTCLLAMLTPALERQRLVGRSVAAPGRLRRFLVRSPLASNPFVYRELVRWLSGADRGWRVPAGPIAGAPGLAPGVRGDGPGGAGRVHLEHAGPGPRGHAQVPGQHWVASETLRVAAMAQLHHARTGRYPAAATSGIDYRAGVSWFEVGGLQGHPRASRPR